ncbi:hypothetical protein ACOMHN_060128 [Nucella lapillus]
MMKEGMDGWRKGWMKEWMDEGRKKIDADVHKEVEVATEKAKTDPELPLADLYNHIYSEPPSGMKVRGCDISIMADTK